MYDDSFFKTMDKYYEEMIAEVESLMNEKNYEEAFYMIKKELNMPYVPQDIEKQLLKYQRDIQYYMSDAHEQKEVSLNTLLNKLKGNDQSQLMAVSQLDRFNLRQCLYEIKDYLAKDPCPEARALLINTIAQQEIQEEFTVEKDGLEYSFYGDSVTPVEKSIGLLKAENYLNEWLANDSPDLYEMAKTVLVHQAYLYLPLSFEEEESLPIAKMALEEVSSLMDDGETYKRIMKQLNDLALMS